MQTGLSHRKNRGSVLLLCLGVLALLSLLGSALVFMSAKEQEASKEYLDETRAQFISESGVETALAKLMSYEGDLLALPNAIAASPADSTLPLEYLEKSSFGIEDSDGNGTLDSAGIVSETYIAKGDRFKLRVESTQRTLNINDSNDPLNIDSDPYFDQLSPGFDYKSLPAHLRDPSGMDPDWIYPEMGALFDPRKSPEGKPYPKTKGRLETIIANLVSVLFPNDPDKPEGPDNPAPTLGENVAKILMDARDLRYKGRFNSFFEIRDLVVPNLLNSAQYKLFEAQLCLDSWRDDTVLKPTFQWRVSRPATNPEYYVKDRPRHIFYGFGMPGLEEVYFDRPEFGTICLENQRWWQGGRWRNEKAIPPFPDWQDWDEDNNNNTDIYLYSDMQNQYFQTTSRSPVDLNNASQSLIEALLRPLEGWYLKEAPDFSKPGFRPSCDLTVDDWSMPAVDEAASGMMLSHHRWHYGCGKLLHFQINNPFCPEDWNGYVPLIAPDQNLFYYFDELAKATTNHWQISPNAFHVEHAQKTARFGELQKVSLPVNIAGEIAKSLYERVHLTDFSGDAVIDHNPFRTWDEFESFIVGMADGDGVGDLEGFNLYMAHMLIANFNPNSRINDFNPNKRIYLHVDKSQMAVNTTEFCFHPMGIFDLRSFGEVRYSDDKPAARHKVRVLLNSGLFPFRLTTQSQFMKGYSPFDGGFQAEDFLSRNVEGVTRTAGLLMSGAGPISNYKGCALQSYPEPECATQNYIGGSHYDGYLMRAIYKPAVTDFDHLAGVLGFYMNGLKSLSAEVSAPNREVAVVDAPGDKWVQQPISFVGNNISPSWYYPEDYQAMAPRNDCGLFPLSQAIDDYEASRKGGNMFPDGLFSDTGRSWTFCAPSIGDALTNGRIGSLGFWCKPAFDPAYSNRIRQIFTLTPKNITVRSLDPVAVGRPEIKPGWKCDDKFFGSDFALYYFAHGGPRVDEITQNNIGIYDPDLRGGAFSTRSFYMHSVEMPSGFYYPGKPYTYPGLGSTTVNHSYHEPEEPVLSDASYHFEARQWSFIGVSWDFNPAPALFMPYMRMTINGLPLGDNRLSQSSDSSKPLQKLHLADGDYENYVRFGESSSAPFRNFSADCTFDNIFSTNVYEAVDQLREEFDYGRYYEGEDAIYKSPLMPLKPGLVPEAGVYRLCQIFWTAYYPGRENINVRASNGRFNENRVIGGGDAYNNLVAPKRPISGADVYPADPCAEEWGLDMAPFSVDILNPESGKWFYDDIPNDLAFQKPNYAGGSIDPKWKNNLRWKAGDVFGFKVHFNLDFDLGQTLFTSPVLDDVEFMFQSDKAVILNWENNYQE